MEFGRVTQVLDEDGNTKGYRFYITKDAVLKRGDTGFLNTPEDSLTNKVKYNIISEDEKVSKLSRIAELDSKFNRITKFVLKLGKRKGETAS